MEIIQAKDNRLSSLLYLVDMQTGFYTSVLEGITDTDAHKRLDTKANHVAWLAGTLVQQRFEMFNWITEGNEQQKGHDLFKDNQGIKDGITYPTLEEYKKDWKHISPKLKDALVNRDNTTFDKIIEIPGMEFTLFEMLTFMIYREANCIGQIALWRRLLGYEPMKYM